MIRTIEGHEEQLSYDQLIVALGSVSRSLPVPGLAEYARGFKTLPDAVELRNHVLQTLESAETVEDPAVRQAWLTYVFVGAGYAGLEGLAELQDFAADVIELYPRCRTQGMRWILVEAQERVMPEVQPSLAEFATRELRGRGIEIRTSTTLEEVTETTARLSDGEVVPTRTRRVDGGREAAPGDRAASGCRWTAAGASAPTARCASTASTTSGRSATPPRCRIRREARQPSPPTAQHAIRQGRRVARNVAASIGTRQGRARSPTRRWACSSTWARARPWRATLGIKWRGAPAWWLARTYHLAMMPASSASCGCSSTGTSGCSSAATPRSSAASATRRGSGEESAGGTAATGPAATEPAAPS